MLFSTQISTLVQCLDFYNEVNVEYFQAKDIKGHGMSRILIPKSGIDQYPPIIKIYDGNTNDFYDISYCGDYYTVKIIMEMIASKIIVNDENKELLYCLFVLLHEAGHWYDYIENPSTYQLSNFDDYLGGNNSEASSMEYRNRPLELIADAFAIEHLVDAWTQINKKLFRGNLPKLILKK